MIITLEILWPVKNKDELFLAALGPVFIYLPLHQKANNYGKHFSGWAINEQLCHNG